MALCFLQVLCEPVVQYLAGSEQRIAPFWNIITRDPTKNMTHLIETMESDYSDDPEVIKAAEKLMADLK